MNPNGPSRRGIPDNSLGAALWPKDENEKMLTRSIELEIYKGFLFGEKFKQMSSK